jgi:16S rRNA (cytidine1402-2'-O)-methyltransferase
MTKKGTLFLIPNSLGHTDIYNTIPAAVISIIQKTNFYIVENERNARRFLRLCGYSGSFDSCRFFLLNKHSGANDILEYILPLIEGQDVGLLSEAGAPAIADPGNIIVSAAHKNDIGVVPLTGPISLMLALMASGFNGQNFSFTGYLPVNSAERIKKIKELESQSYTNDQTQIFIETPYRNNQLLKDILASCRNTTRLCVASQLTCTDEVIISDTIAHWRRKTIDFHKKAAVFLIYRSY